MSPSGCELPEALHGRVEFYDDSAHELNTAFVQWLSDRPHPGVSRDTLVSALGDGLLVKPAGDMYFFVTTQDGKAVVLRTNKEEEATAAATATCGVAHLIVGYMWLDGSLKEVCQTL